MMLNYWIVFIATGLGGVLRYALSCCWENSAWHIAFCNIIGSFLIGIIFALRSLLPQAWQELACFSFLGGFTTFSAYMLYSYQLHSSTGHWAALNYLTISLIGGIISFYVGYYVSKLIMTLF